MIYFYFWIAILRNTLPVNFRVKTRWSNSNGTMHLCISDEIQSVHGSLQNPRKHVFSVLPINKTCHADTPLFFHIKILNGKYKIIGRRKNEHE